MRTKFQVFLEKNPEYKEKLKPPKIGKIIEGKILEKDESGIYIEIPGFGLGFLSKKEVNEKEMKEGKEIKVKIQNYLPKEGMFLLSLSEAQEEMAWQELENLEKEKTFIPLKAIGANRGGLIFEFSGIQGFLPTSQLSKNHYPKLDNPTPEAIFEALKKLVGKEFKVRVLLAERKQKRLIFSEK